MESTEGSKSILSKPAVAMPLAFLCALTWSLAFPLIKIGQIEMHIDPGDFSSVALFAGIRFTLAGVVVLILAKLMRRSFKVSQPKGVWLLVLFSLSNIGFHYLFFYIGVVHQAGSRSAIIDSVGTFMVIVLSCLFFKDDKMTLRKVAGCLIGFGGILLANADAGAGLFSGFSLAGDGAILLGTTFWAFGGILTRFVSKYADNIFSTGVSMALGGFVLVLIGVAFGGSVEVSTLKGVAIYAAMIAVSVVGFSVYNQLLVHNPVSRIAIFNSLIPILGVIMSSLLAGEPLKLAYLAAGAVVAVGIVLVNLRKESKPFAEQAAE